MASASKFYEFVPRNNKNEEFPLSQFRNKVVLIVNVASQCGFTRQYEPLEALYQSVSKQYPGEFTILGFPSNEFGGQEPGSNEEIQTFCKGRGVTFPIMAKVEVNGSESEPLYEWLRSQKTWFGIGKIKWNFEKFLIDRDGKVVERWASTASPESLEKSIKAELEKKA